MYWPILLATDDPASAWSAISFPVKPFQYVADPVNSATVVSAINDPCAVPPVPPSFAEATAVERNATYSTLLTLLVVDGTERLDEMPVRPPTSGVSEEVVIFQL